MHVRWLNVLLAVLLLGLTACGKPRVALTDSEKKLAESTGLSQSLLLDMKKAGENLRTLSLEAAPEGKELPSGVTIDVSPAKAPGLVTSLQRKIPGGFVALETRRPLAGATFPSEVSVFKAKSPFDAVIVAGTGSKKYNITSEKLVDQLRAWDAQFGLNIVGTGPNWLEAAFQNLPPNVLTYSGEVFLLCPDIVAQGSGSVELLASEIQRTRHIVLWWDERSREDLPPDVNGDPDIMPVTPFGPGR